MAARHHNDLARDSHDPHSHHRANVFSDDYAESLSEDYADSQDGMSIRRSPSIRSLPSERLHSLTHNSENFTHPNPISLPRSHDSISKTPPPVTASPSQDTPRDPFADNADEPFTPTPGSDATPRSSGYAATAHRSLSASSFAGSQHHTSIHEGPSHPYAMYPQALAISRTPSVATSSTRPMSIANTGGSRGPTHPYESFAQTVPGDTPLPIQNTIPIGFPGANSSFTRRLGPEGEEQDIIGADGHAEQLPPYSRYPEEVHLKATNLSALPPIGESSPTQAAAPTSSAFDARSSRSHLPLISSSRRPVSVIASDDGTGLSEKSWKEKSWRERRNARFCGVPLWAWLSALAFFLFIILVAGAIIGGILRNKSGGHDDDDDDAKSSASTPAALRTTTATPTKTVTSPTQLVDAEPVTSTPSSIVPLPSSGVYQLDTDDATGLFSGCLPDNEALAWSCKLPDNKLAVELDTSGQTPMLSLMPTDQDVWYGVQPPYIQAQPLNLVFDVQTPGYPMAYQFQTIYKKRVVLPEWQLDFNSTGVMPRGFDPQFDISSGFPFGIQNKALNKVDEPWFCEWPQTFLEVMIYVGNGSTISTNSSMTNLSTSTPPAAASSTLSASDSSSSKSKSAPSAAPVSQATNDLKQKRHFSSSSSETSFSKSATPASFTSTTVSGESGYSPPPAAPSRSLSLFPQMVKIEERRLKNEQGNGPMPPTCTQMTGAGGAQTNYVPKLINNVNQILVFKLNETSPQIPKDQLHGSQIQKEKRMVIEERGYSPNSGCYCAWNSPNRRGPPIGQSEAQYFALRGQGSTLGAGAKVKRWWLDEN